MGNSKCENPELRPKIGECSREQIKRCHGDNVEHTCDDSKEE